MFHEPYFYFSWRHPLGNVLALVQRAMAAVLLRASDVVYLSTETWVRYLRPLAPRRSRWSCLRCRRPSSRPRTRATSPGGARVTRRRTAAPQSSGISARTAITWRASSCASSRSSSTRTRKARFICIGRGSDAFARGSAGRTRRSPDASTAPATSPRRHRGRAARVRRGRAAVPDGVTTRRTSVMAALANGVPIVSTAGALTEAVWRETGAVALAPASDARAIGAAVVALLQRSGRHGDARCRRPPHLRRAVRDRPDARGAAGRSGRQRMTGPPLRILLVGDYADDPRLGSAKVTHKLRKSCAAPGTTATRCLPGTSRRARRAGRRGSSWSPCWPRGRSAVRCRASRTTSSTSPAPRGCGSEFASGWAPGDPRRSSADRTGSSI